MAKRLPVIVILLVLLSSCGGAEGGPLDTGRAETTPSTDAPTTTIPPSSTTTAAPIVTTVVPTTFVTTTTTVVTTTTPPTTAGSTIPVEPPGPEFGPLAGFDEYLFQDPFDPAHPFLHMEWLPDRGLLRSQEWTTEGWLALGPFRPAPEITGITDDQLLLEAWIDLYGGDIVPVATVLYTLDVDRWVADLVIDPWVMEAALLETPGYASAAPDGPVAVDTAVTSFDWTARTFRADIGVYDYFTGFTLVYEGTVDCVIAEPLACVERD